MIFKEDYMDIAIELLSEMRLLVEGAINLYEDDTAPLMRLARDHDEAEALSALNDLGAALYIMRRHIKRLQAEHLKASTSKSEDA